LKRSWWERFKLSSAHTQANIVCTILIMLATIGYAGIAGNQLILINRQIAIMQGALDETRRSGEQSTEQMWQAVGNINWIARTADQSTKDNLAQIKEQTAIQGRAANTAKSVAVTADASLKSSQQQFRTEQRPLVWATPGVSVAGNPLSVTSLADLKKQNLPLIIELGAINGGRSPATEVRLTEITVVFDDTAAAESKVREYKPSYLSSEGGAIMMPNQTFLFFNTRPLMLTDEFMTDLATRKKTMFVLAGAEYTDIFSPTIPPYKSQFCYRINPFGLPFGDCGILGTEWIQ